MKEQFKDYEAQTKYVYVQDAASGLTTDELCPRPAAHEGWKHFSLVATHSRWSVNICWVLSGLFGHNVHKTKSN